MEAGMIIFSAERGRYQSQAVNRRGLVRGSTLGILPSSTDSLGAWQLASDAVLPARGSLVKWYSRTRPVGNPAANSLPIKTTYIKLTVDPDRRPKPAPMLFLLSRASYSSELLY